MGGLQGKVASSRDGKERSAALDRPTLGKNQGEVRVAPEECQVPFNQCHQPPNKSVRTSLSLFLFPVTEGTVPKILLYSIFLQLLASFSLMSDIHSLTSPRLMLSQNFCFNVLLPLHG